jgi:nucleotide-binding universal stress UspA family protein
MFTTFLVPLDGSALGDRALPYAIALARRAGGKAILLHAIWNAIFPREDGFSIEDRANEVRAMAPGVPIDSRVWGYPRQEELGRTLGEASIELGADLIVMSTHGRSGLGRWLYGSVADQVLRQTNVPVLLIPAMSEYRWPEDRPLRVLVALDGSAYAEHAMTLARALDGKEGVDLHLLRVVEPPDDARQATMALGPAQAEAEQYLQAQADTVRSSGDRVTTVVRTGPPAGEIVIAAREAGADLIALATHGRGGVARLTLGSVATTTLQRADVPLLLVRPLALDQTEVAAP